MPQETIIHHHALRATHTFPEQEATNVLSHHMGYVKQGSTAFKVQALQLRLLNGANGVQRLLQEVRSVTLTTLE